MVGRNFCVIEPFLFEAHNVEIQRTPEAVRWNEGLDLDLLRKTSKAEGLEAEVFIEVTSWPASTRFEKDSSDTSFSEVPLQLSQQCRPQAAALMLRGNKHFFKVEVPTVDPALWPAENQGYGQIAYERSEANESGIPTERGKALLNGLLAPAIVPRWRIECRSIELRKLVETGRLDGDDFWGHGSSDVCVARSTVLSGPP